MRVVLGVTHSDENFILRIEDEQVPPDDRIQAVAYSEHNRLLCAGTSKGYILFWRQTSVCLRSSPCLVCGGLAVCLAVCLKALAVCLKAMRSGNRPPAPTTHTPVSYACMLARARARARTHTHTHTCRCKQGRPQRRTGSPCCTPPQSSNTPSMISGRPPHSLASVCVHAIVCVRVCVSDIHDCLCGPVTHAQHTLGTYGTHATPATPATPALGRSPGLSVVADASCDTHTHTNTRTRRADGQRGTGCWQRRRKCRAAS